MRARLPGAAAVVGVAGAVLLPAAPAGAVLVPAVPAAAGPQVDRPVRDARVTEASGLAVSQQHPGVLWTHDDSGHAPLLFALARDGRVAATLRLRGAADVDWEALAAFRDAAGRALLAVGDLGDNRGDRSRVEVDVVAEPARLHATTGNGSPGGGVAPLLRLLLTYPDRSADAEALLVDTARRRMFVVTKGLFGGAVYVVPAAAWDGSTPRRPTVRSARLIRVGTVPLGLVTDGTVAPGGAVLLRTYTQVAAFPPFPLQAGDAYLGPAASAALPLQRQGEGLALTPDGRSLLLSSEGPGEPVLRFELPASVEKILVAAPTATTSMRSGRSQPPAASQPWPSTAAAALRTWARSGSAGVVAGAVALVLAVAGCVLIRRQLRR